MKDEARRDLFALHRRLLQSAPAPLDTRLHVACRGRVTDRVNRVHFSRRTGSATWINLRWVIPRARAHATLASSRSLQSPSSPRHGHVIHRSLACLPSRVCRPTKRAGGLLWDRARDVGAQILTAATVPRSRQIGNQRRSAQPRYEEENALPAGRPALALHDACRLHDAQRSALDTHCLLSPSVRCLDVGASY